MSLFPGNKNFLTCSCVLKKRGHDGPQWRRSLHTGEMQDSCIPNPAKTCRQKDKEIKQKLVMTPQLRLGDLQHHEFS